MPIKTRFDIDCETLGLYFAHEIEKISPQAKAELPKDVSFKLFRGGGKLNTNSTSKLGFIAKLYILWKALNKRWWIVIEDEDNGMTPGQFMDLRKAYRKRDYGMDQANILKSSGTLVMANKELSECFAYLNYLSSSGAYNYIMRAKNSPKNKCTEWNRERSWVAKFLINYDSQKKSISANCGLTIPELYVLLILFDGSEVSSSFIYKEKLKRAYQSTPSKIKLAFRTLQTRGFITKTGVIKGVKLRITPLGRDILNGILDKYILNC